MTPLALSRVPVRCDADARHNLSADALVMARHVIRHRENGLRALAVDWSRGVIAAADSLIAAKSWGEK